MLIYIIVFQGGFFVLNPNLFFFKLLFQFFQLLHITMVQDIHPGPTENDKAYIPEILSYTLNFFSSFSSFSTIPPYSNSL